VKDFQFTMNIKLSAVVAFLLFILTGCEKSSLIDHWVNNSDISFGEGFEVQSVMQPNEYSYKGEFTADDDFFRRNESIGNLMAVNSVTPSKSADLGIILEDFAEFEYLFIGRGRGCIWQMAGSLMDKQIKGYFVYIFEDSSGDKPY